MVYIPFQFTNERFVLVSSKFRFSVVLVLTFCCGNQLYPKTLSLCLQCTQAISCQSLDDLYRKFVCSVYQLTTAQNLNVRSRGGQSQSKQSLFYTADTYLSH